MKLLLGLSAFACAAAVSANEPAKPLFASDGVLALTIQGPVDLLSRGEPESARSVTGTIAEGGGAALPIRLELRGITRRQRDVCQFPPLRVTFDQPAPASSLFAGQRRLKLVTHCRGSEDFQQHVLLEYAAYRLYNQLTPMSFRARLARIDYRTSDGRPITTRYGFFIEDIYHVAARNGMREAEVGSRIPVPRLSPVDAARFGLFEYMIGNLDWAMQAGPAGDNCCHNSRLIGVGGAAAATLVPVPYDFDFSGLVNAPYATPPGGIPVASVRQRRYRGFCRFGAEARALLPAFRQQQGAIRGVISSVPDMKPATRSRAISYLDGFFSDIATDKSAEAKLFRTCL